MLGPIGFGDTLLRVPNGAFELGVAVAQVILTYGRLLSHLARLEKHTQMTRGRSGCPYRAFEGDLAREDLDGPHSSQ
jgi:hypothetical protein